MIERAAAAAASALVLIMTAAIPVAAKAEVLEDVGTVMAVVDPATTPDFPVGSLMRADCAVVVRIPAEDGSASEWMACQLSEGPVMVPENQGVPPDATITYGGGPCTWISDYLANGKGIEVFADAFEVTVTPSGHAFAWSTYAPEPAECEPAAVPSALASPTMFTSDIHGYSLAVPPGWTTVQATEAWDGQGSPSHEQPVADQFVGPSPASAWGYAAPTASALAAYAEGTIAATNADHGDTCPSTPEAQEPIDIGGEPGTLLSWDCGILINLAVTVHDGIGYLFGFRDPAIHAATDEADRVIFEQLLASVRFPE